MVGLSEQLPEGVDRNDGPTGIIGHQPAHSL